MIIRAELKCKQTGCEADPCAVAAWIFEKYGQDCMENNCVTKTEFGLLRRLEPPFPEQRQGQRMM